MVYAALAMGTARQIGLVGEVAIGWALPSPPAVLVGFDPPTWADGALQPTTGHALGPLIASQVRPIERIVIGEYALPLAINTYTGGPPDWPAAVVFGLTGSTKAVVGLHVLLGATLLILVRRFLRFHASALAGGLAALTLATDWCFVFYRKVLGGTEIVLLAATLLTVWALWSRRWRGGPHGLMALAVGVAFGLMAKATFALTAAAVVITSILTRGDRPPVGPPRAERLTPALLAMLGLTAPLWITALHHALAVPAELHVRSHDFPGVQLSRVLGALTGGPGPAREGWINLSYWAGDPLGFLVRAYGAEGGGWSPWAVVAWGVLISGSALAWVRPRPGPRDALLRFTSLLLVVQTAIILGVARDLHHLAVGSITRAIVTGLAVERLCALTTPARSFARLRLALLLAAPTVIAGVSALLATDAAVRSIPTPTFTWSGQESLRGMLRDAGVERLTVSDYETTGVLEVTAPEIDVVHTWGATSRMGRDAWTPTLREAAGGHLLVVDASAPMIYNLRASERRLMGLASEAGVELERVAALPDDTARLYLVR